MKGAFAGLGKGGASLTRATEPRGYDRRFYASVLLVGFLFILLATVTLIYVFATRTVTVPRVAGFDLRSLFIVDSVQMPDPGNPCIVLQAHLEALRTGSYSEAYDYLCAGLKKEVTPEGMAENARANNLYFRAVSRYSSPSYEQKETSAEADGYIYYSDGGRSRVAATFAREGSAWRIARMTVIYE